MNNCNFVGNLGSDAEIAVIPNSGTTVCSFSIATTSGYGDKEKTTWIKCGLFGKRAEGNLPQYLTKGTQVAISGEIYLDEWQGKDGTTQKMLKMNVDKLKLCGPKPDQPQQTVQQPQQQPTITQQQPQTMQQPVQQVPQPAQGYVVDEETPF